MNSEERIEAAAKAYVNVTAPLGWSDLSPESWERVKAGMQAAFEATDVDDLVEALEQAQDQLVHLARWRDGREGAAPPERIQISACLANIAAALTGDKSNG